MDLRIFTTFLVIFGMFYSTVSKLGSPSVSHISYSRTRRSNVGPTTSLVVFGASYCDNGHARDKRYEFSLGAYPNDSGRRSNGRVWPEYLASAINAHLYDYAFSGATAGESGGVPDTSQQIEGYISDLKNGNIQAGTGRTFFVIWVGINSVNHIWQQGRGEGAIQAEVDRVHQQIERLAAHPTLQNVQAQYIVMTLPPLEVVPNSIHLASQSGDPAGSLARIKSLTYAYNQGLRALQCDRIHVLDIVPLWSSVANNPAMYGFSQTRKPCLEGNQVCADPSAYLYWDSLHPTTKMHRLISDRVREFLGN